MPGPRSPPPSRSDSMPQSHGKHDHAGHDHSHGRGHAHHHSGHGPGPGHGHGHAHAHPPHDYGRAFAIGISLNAAFVAIEFGFGLVADSLALVADAGHNLSDVLGLVLAWSAMRLARRPPSDRFTYGLRGSSILAAMANALLLAVACGAIGWEAISRFSAPPPVASTTMIVVAAIGILVNGATALLFMRGSADDLNIRGAYLHMVADAAVSATVVAAGLAIWFTGWQWVDPLLGLVVVVVILWGAWSLFGEAMRLALAGVPAGIDAAGVRGYLSGRSGVTEVHDLHIWAMSTTEVALTAHLVVPAGHPGDEFLATLCHDLEHQFGIHHPTVQIECGVVDCKLAPDSVV